VADGADVRDLIPADDRIRLIQLEGTFNIGTKRNFGCEHAAGEYIAHWDDDDFSASGRLSDQLGRLQASGRSVTGYQAMRFTDGARWWQYAGPPNFALGTSLFYRRAWWMAHPFRLIQVGEDNQFVGEAHGAAQLIVADAGDLMYATIHAGNTSPRTLGTAWTEIPEEEVLKGVK
jgi:glycosyltransferase involved in cell wall biosynthesis